MRTRAALVVVALVAACAPVDAREDGGGDIDGGGSAHVDDGGANGVDGGPNGDDGGANVADGGANVVDGGANGVDGGPNGDDGGADVDVDGGATWWRPTKGDTWQITLQEPPTSRDQDVDVWDLDLFDTPAETIALLQAGGTRVVCYFSAGTYEPYRPDADDFPPSVLGDAYEDPAFADERYLDVNDPAVLAIQTARLDLAVDKGCDGVDPDNVDLFDHATGFTITMDDMAAFNLALVDAAHARGLAVGLKNDLAQLDAIADAYDFAVNEECVAFDECDVYADNLLADDKPVFHIEYVDASAAAAVCAVTQPLGLSTVIKSYDLDATVTYCP